MGAEDEALAEVVRALSTGAPLEASGLARVLGEDAAPLPPAEAGFLLGALAARMRGDDAAALIAALRQQAPAFDVRGQARPTVDIVGTGGGRSTFNISTCAAFVVAAAGLTVVKTGASAYASRSGFAETAAALGALLDLEPAALVEVAREVGIVLVPPARYAPALRRLAAAVSPSPFKRLGGFVNAVGPLLSPFRVDLRVVGASTPRVEAMIAGAAAAVASEDVTVVHGLDGIDEVSPIGETRISSVRGGASAVRTVRAAELTGEAPAWADLEGAAPRAAARLVSTVLEGKGTAAQRSAVALNAALVLVEAGRRPSLPAAYAEACALLDAGRPAEVLTALRRALEARRAAAP